MIQVRRNQIGTAHSLRPKSLGHPAAQKKPLGRRLSCLPADGDKLRWVLTKKRVVPSGRRDKLHPEKLRLW